MTEPPGSAWQRNACVRNFFVTHGRTLAHPVRRYRELDDTACPWLFVLTTCLGFFGAVALGSVLVWWTLPLGVDSHAPFASLLSANAIDAKIVRESMSDLVRACLIAGILFLPGLALAVVIALLGSRHRPVFSVVIPHATAWSLVPLLAVVALAPVACATRFIWQEKSQSAGGELLILAIGLAYLAASVGFAGSTIAGARALRQRSKARLAPKAPGVRTGQASHVVLHSCVLGAIWFLLAAAWASRHEIDRNEFVTPDWRYIHEFLIVYAMFAGLAALVLLPTVFRPTTPVRSLYLGAMVSAVCVAFSAPYGSLWGLIVVSGTALAIPLALLWFAAPLVVFASVVIYWVGAAKGWSR